MKADNDISGLNWLAQGIFCRRILPFLCCALVLLGNFYVFAVVPNERVMGAVQRIFYFHVGAAMGAYLMIAVLFVASICYLNSRSFKWDALGEAAASVGFVFCSIVLASGMIWGHSAWNTWWRWEPRLVSFLVLWLLLFSYTVLRSFTADSSQRRNFAAVLGILAAVNVPIVIFSIKLLDQAQQLHPEVVAQQGLRDESFVVALVICIAAMLAASLWLLKLKFVNSLLIRRAELISRDAVYLETD